jgi:ubiquinone/menaquinone biosynthesis C-methylase UbiE
MDPAEITKIVQNEVDTNETIRLDIPSRLAIYDKTKVSKEFLAAIEVVTGRMFFTVLRDNINFVIASTEEWEKIHPKDEDAIKIIQHEMNVNSTIWIDMRNRLAVYNRKNVSPEFLAAMDNKTNFQVIRDDPEIGGKRILNIVTVEEWENRKFVDDPTEYKAGFFDESYFSPGPKSCFKCEYKWDMFKDTIYAEMRAILKLKPKKLLDVGCAKGFLCKAMLENGVEAYGCDISQWAIDNCEPEVKGRLRQFELDGKTPLPYADNEFDVVASSSLLEHIKPEYIEYAFREMCRVTSNWVCVAVPVSLTKDNMPWGDPTHKCFMTLSWWIAEAWKSKLLYNWQQSQFEVVKLQDIASNVGGYLVFQKNKLELNLEKYFQG